MGKKARRFDRFGQILDFAMKGRSPYKNGVPFRTFGRLHVNEEHTEITFSVHDDKICTITSDNVLTFIATDKTIRTQQYTLSSSFRSFLPVHFINFDTGKYKVCHEGTTPKRRVMSYDGQYYEFNDWNALRKSGQEYFQHLKLDLCTGKIINPKDMAPDVNEDRRKEWLRNLKAYRLRLRTMARIGAFDNVVRERSYHNWWDGTHLNKLADAIMAQDFSPEAMQLVIARMGAWKYRTVPPGEAVVDVFESAVKSNSRDMRLHLGVLVAKE
jgi:hypothetical protein